MNTWAMVSCSATPTRPAGVRLIDGQPPPGKQQFSEEQRADEASTGVSEGADAEQHVHQRENPEQRDEAGDGQRERKGAPGSKRLISRQHCDEAIASAQTPREMSARSKFQDRGARHERGLARLEYGLQEL